MNVKSIYSATTLPETTSLIYLFLHTHTNKGLKRKDNMTFLIYKSQQQQTAWKIESEYDQEIPQSQTADNPIAPQGRAAKPSRDTRKTN